jgi:general stress protein 26
MNDHVAIPTLTELLEGLRIGMLGTHRNGALITRPITTLDIEGIDTLWFFVAADSAIATEVDAEEQVCVSYVDTAGNRYVSARGRGAIIADTERIAQLWSPSYTVWFDGPDDPNLALLRVVVTEVEYWDAPASTLGRFIAFTTALATGDAGALGAHGRGAPGTN